MAALGALHDLGIAAFDDYPWAAAISAVFLHSAAFFSRDDARLAAADDGASLGDFGVVLRCWSKVNAREYVGVLDELDAVAGRLDVNVDARQSIALVRARVVAAGDPAKAARHLEAQIDAANGRFQSHALVALLRRDAMRCREAAGEDATPILVEATAALRRISAELVAHPSLRAAWESTDANRDVARRAAEAGL